MKTAILVGYGEIGKAVKEVFKSTIDIHVYDYPIYEQVEYLDSYDLMFVAFPYDDDFIDQVKGYQERFNPKGTIIFSTVQIGTTDQIEHAVHSPIEGKHPNLAESIRLAPRWVGGESGHWNAFIADFFINCGLDVHFVLNAKTTEFLKLSSTSLYGVNIEFARYRKVVCDELGIDYRLVKEFDQDYNELYKMLGLEQYQRYILDPPEGPIGGHCVTENSVILNKFFPSKMLRMIFNKNE